MDPPRRTLLLCSFSRRGPVCLGLMARLERVQPYALNAATLATRGVDTLGGALRRGLPFDAGWPLANRLLGALTASVPLGINTLELPR